MLALTTPAPTTAAPARAWLPAPNHPLTEAACPVCGALDGLYYSLTHSYICCVACGWQRRLETPDQFQAALVYTRCIDWRRFVVDLAARASDALPPVAALLWRQTGPTTWAGPSRTTPDTTYTITRYPSGHVHCSCPHLGRGCWHRTRAAELGCVATPVPADLWPD